MLWQFRFHVSMGKEPRRKRERVPRVGKLRRNLKEALKRFLRLSTQILMVLPATHLIFLVPRRFDRLVLVDHTLLRLWSGESSGLSWSFISFLIPFLDPLVFKFLDFPFLFWIPPRFTHSFLQCRHSVHVWVISRPHHVHLLNRLNEETMLGNRSHYNHANSISNNH